MTDSILTGKLDNDLTYYVRKTDIGHDIIYVSFVAKVGSVNDAEFKGISHLLEHCNMSFHKYRLHRPIDYHATAHTEYYCTKYIFTCKIDTVKKVLSIIQNIMDGCYINSESLSDIKNDIFTEQREKENNADYQIVKELFKGTAYHDFLPIGQAEIVRDLSCRQVEDFFAEWYIPDNVAIIVAGNIDVASIVNEIGQLKQPSNNQEKIKAASSDHYKYEMLDALSIQTSIKSDIKQKQLDYFYGINQESHMTADTEIQKGFILNYSLDVFGKVFFEGNLYGLAYRSGQQTYLSRDCKLFQISLIDKRGCREYISREELWDIARAYTEDNFASLNNEYRRALGDFESYTSLYQMMNQCIEMFIYEKPIYDSLFEKKILSKYLEVLEVDAIKNTLLDITMNGTIIYA
jgi:hypothetical protein